MCVKMSGLSLLVAALLVAGCENKTEPTKANMPDDKKNTPKETPKDGDKPKPKEHTHGAGPNGGVVFDLGKFHAEFTVNHDKKECTIVMVAGDEKTLKAVAAKELNLTTKPSKTKDGKNVPAMTIKLLPKDAKDGIATTFVGTDPGLGNVADFEGTVAGEIDGQPSTGQFKE